MNKEINWTLIERYKLIALIEYLDHKINLVEDEGIRRVLTIEKEKSERELFEVENDIVQNGFLLLNEDIGITFDKINKEIDELNNSKELLQWIKVNCGQDQLNYIEEIEMSGKQFNNKMTGKWVGKFISNEGFAPGEFVVGACQLGNKILGYGTLIGSIYSRIFIKGLIDENEVKVELLGLEEQVKTFFEGNYDSREKTASVTGNYYLVDGFDNGTIESSITKDIIVPLSEKTNNLVLVSKLKKKIGSSEAKQLIEILDKIAETFGEHENESILHKKRINTLLKDKRIRVISYSESQLEESKITSDILNLISQIEMNLKSN